MRLEITDELVDALVDPHDDTPVALRAALLRELASEVDSFPTVVQPYRVIVIASDRSRETFVVQLTSGPRPGDELELLHGETVLVHHVGSGAPYGLAGVIIAGPADQPAPFR